MQLTIGLTISVIGACCTVLIITAIIIDIINKLNKTSSDATTNLKWKSVLILTNIALFSYLIHASSVTFIHFNLYPKNDFFCLWLSRCNTAIYHITRCTFYALLTTRVYITFNNSIYSYNHKLIICLFTMIILWFIAAMICDLIINAVSGYYSTNNEFTSCQPTFASWGIALSGFIDISLSLISLILFIRPLLKLNKLNQLRAQKQIEHTITKTEHEHTTTINVIQIPITPPAPKQIEIPMFKTIESASCTPVDLKPFRSIAGIRITSASFNNDITEITQFPSVLPPIMPDPHELEQQQTDTCVTNTNTNSDNVLHHPVQTSGTVTVTVSSGENATATQTDTCPKMNLKTKVSRSRTISRVNSKNNTGNDDELDELIARYALLVSIAIISSVIFHAIVVMWPWTADLSPIDDAINVWCIVLINKTNNKMYHRLCGSCNSVMKLCCKR